MPLRSSPRASVTSSGCRRHLGRYWRGSGVPEASSCVPFFVAVRFQPTAMLTSAGGGTRPSHARLRCRPRGEPRSSAETRRFRQPCLTPPLVARRRLATPTPAAGNATTGQPSTDPTGSDRRIYICPHFPSVPFYLVALDGGWSMGPFNETPSAMAAPAGLLVRTAALPGATTAAVTTSACGSATRTATSSTPTTGTSGQCVPDRTRHGARQERTGTTPGLTDTNRLAARL